MLAEKVRESIWSEVWPSTHITSLDVIGSALKLYGEPVDGGLVMTLTSTFMEGFLRNTEERRGTITVPGGDEENMSGVVGDMGWK